MKNINEKEFIAYLEKMIDQENEALEIARKSNSSEEVIQAIIRRRDSFFNQLKEFISFPIKEWTDYERQCKIVVAAVKWLDRYLHIVHGRREKNVELTYGLPYTSSGEFAAIWNTNVNAVSRDDIELQFKGVALDKDENPVIIWYKADRDEWRFTTVKDFQVENYL